MASRDEFVAWALSPERTLEEAYCAERLVEQGRLYWPSSSPRRHPKLAKQQQERKRKRRLNPAHRAQFDEGEVRCAADKLLMMDRLDLDSESDRPLRDILGLRFFSHFRHLNLRGNELGSVGSLRGWTALESLCIRDDALEDLTPLAALTKLRSLELSIRSPWPTLEGLEALEQLEYFRWCGNLLSLEDIPRLGKVSQARFTMGPCGNLPLPSVNLLPEMPWLEAFEIDPLFRLDDITRWPRLRNLTAGGPFKDLRPLTGLRSLTHLTLTGDDTRDLSPLARLPELRRLEVRSQHPHDYSVLAEAPRLHEVKAEGCKINNMELATLHAVLAPWDDEFLVTPARPQGPARFVVCHQTELPSSPRQHLETLWNDDPELAASEARWFNQRLLSALDGLFEAKGWGRLVPGPAGLSTLRIHQLEAAEQLADVVDKTRELLCATRFPWAVQFAVSLREQDEDKPGRGIDETDEEERTIQRAVKDLKEFLERQKEQEAYLEREHRLRLLQQEGKPVNQDEFAPPDDPQSEPLLKPVGVATDYGPEPPTLAQQLWTQGVITEEGLFIDERGRLAAEHLMGRKVDRAAA